MKSNKRQAISKMQFVFFLVLAFFLAPAVLGQSNCNDALNKAQKDYADGRFDRLVQTINTCYSALPDYKSKIEARKLKAYSFLAMDSVKKAGEEIEELLNIKPDYETEYNAPASFVKLLNKVRVALSVKLTSSVSKKAERIELAPATIEVITQEDIINRGYQDIEELLHDISGFDISNVKGEQYSLIYQRGYRSDLGDRTLILVNGVEDNGLFTNEAHLTRQYSMSNIKRVEIVYGPASTIYGANAFQGVINIITKDEEDFFKQGGNVAVSANTGYGSRNTRYVDVAAAGRNDHNVSFSLTGRIFKSNEPDLSGFPDYDFKWDPSFFSDSLYSSMLTMNAGGGSFDTLKKYDPNGLYYSMNESTARPTQTAINAARRYDSLTYSVSEVNGQKLQYSNPTDDWYLSGNMKIENLKIGFQLWQKKEGQGPFVTDKFFAGGNNGTIWEVRQFSYFLSYNKSISNRVGISNFTRYKNFSHYPDTRQTIFKSYSNGYYGLGNLAKGVALDSNYTGWNTEYYYLSSKQFRNEMRLTFIANEKLDFVNGIEFRMSNIPQTLLVSAQKNASVNGTTDDNPKGGNTVNYMDLGAFSQVTYKMRKDLIWTLGGRFDYDKARDTVGYGLVFNPRIAAVYTPGNFIFKVVYSSAFKSPSNFQRFGTSAGRVSNPGLRPERVKNIELNGRWNISQALYSELIVYNARYSNAIQTVKINSNELQFLATGSLNISGVQFNMRYRWKRFDAYANYTFTSPYRLASDSNMVKAATEDLYEKKRIGDIADHQVNIGGNLTFFNELLNAHLRTNYVGVRKTGKHTTVKDNPYDQIDPYLVFHGALSLNGKALGREGTLRGVTLQFVVKNIFDKLYYDPGARSADGRILASRIPQNGRSFFMRLLYDFDWNVGKR